MLAGRQGGAVSVGCETHVRCSEKPWWGREGLSHWQAPTTQMVQHSRHSVQKRRTVAGIQPTVGLPAKATERRPSLTLYYGIVIQQLNIECTSHHECLCISQNRVEQTRHSADIGVVKLALLGIVRNAWLYRQVPIKWLPTAVRSMLQPVPCRFGFTILY